jgi:hypothetical protein
VLLFLMFQMEFEKSEEVDYVNNLVNDELEI